MTKWLSLELSFLLIVSVVAVGGLLNLELKEDSGSVSDATAHASLSKMMKKIKRQVAQQAAQVQQPVPQPTPPAPVTPQPPKPSTPPVPFQPAPIQPAPVQPAPLPCPAVDSRGWECFKRDRYISCASGSEVATPLASTSCTFCCMPVQRPLCKVDISNCPDYIKRAYTTTLLVGTPSKGGDMCEITDHNLIAVPTLSIAQYYWKFNAPCGSVLRRA